MKPRIAIMASGSGTTAETFIRANQRGEINVDIGLVIVSRKNAGIFKRIDNLNKELGLNIRTVLINHHTHPASLTEHVGLGELTAGEEAAITAALLSEPFDLIALMGYMKKISPGLIEAFGWLPHYKSAFEAQMLNTHPGLLPDTAGFYGLQIQEYVLDHRLPYSGQTLHAVSEEYDAGPVIAEHKVEVMTDDTPESLFARVQAIEKQYLPKDIEDFIKARRAYLSSR